MSKIIDLLTLIKLSAHGIKCDNRGCGWSDMDAVFDPDRWLNVPCPACGSNLFTPADYRVMKCIGRVTVVFNIVLLPIAILLLPWHVGKSRRAHRSFDLNGTGNVTVRKHG